MFRSTMANQKSLKVVLENVGLRRVRTTTTEAEDHENARSKEKQPRARRPTKLWP